MSEPTMAQVTETISDSAKSMAEANEQMKMASKVLEYIRARDPQLFSEAVAAAQN